MAADSEKTETMTCTYPPVGESANQNPDSSDRPQVYTSDNILRLRKLMFAEIAKGAVARHAVEYLTSMIGKQECICGQDITDHGGPKGDANVSVFISRLRDRFSEFFDYDPMGRTSPYRAVFSSEDRGNYALRLEANKPPNGFVPDFWAPHLSGSNVLVVYPVMELVGDPTAPCLAHSTCSKGLLGRTLTEYPGAGHPVRNGVVFENIVRLVFRLRDQFRSWQTSVTETPVRPWVDIINRDDLIVLATPGSVPLLLANLEAHSPMKTGAEAVTVTPDINKETKSRTYRDHPGNGNAANGFEMVKWGVLTRRVFPFQRTITVIAARDEFGVEAMVHFLLNEKAMLGLARELRCKDGFPNHFQALFRMHMVEGQPYARAMSIEDAIVLDANRKVAAPPKK